MLDGVSYLAFLAPALIATTAMMTSATEALWPLLAGFKWTNQFVAMTATPLRPVDVVGGFALWVATRRSSARRPSPPSSYSSTKRVVGIAAGDRVRGAHRPGVRLAGGRVDVDPRAEISFPAIMRFGLIPLFLFGGAFFPIDQLPAWSRPIAYVTPLYHGVELTRGAVLGTLGLLPRRATWPCSSPTPAPATSSAAARSPGSSDVQAFPGHAGRWALARSRSRRAARRHVGPAHLPAAALEVRRPQRMIERSAMVNRRTWLVMFSGFFEPLFYLLSIRIGVGELIGDVTVDGVTVDYAEFVAPALLAASAMNGAISRRR